MIQGAVLPTLYSTPSFSLFSSLLPWHPVDTSCDKCCLNMPVPKPLYHVISLIAALQRSQLYCVYYQISSGAESCLFICLHQCGQKIRRPHVSAYHFLSAPEGVWEWMFVCAFLKFRDKVSRLSSAARRGGTLTGYAIGKLGGGVGEVREPEGNAQWATLTEPLSAVVEH